MRKPLAALPSWLLICVIAASPAASVCAQDELLKDLFPGVEFSKHPADAETDLYAIAYSRIAVAGREYVALTYYQPYAPSLGYVSYALLELVSQEYRLQLDHLASDGSSGVEYRKPFLYVVDAETLVVFPSYYRGDRYSFFRLDPTPTEVTLQSFDGLGANEWFSRRGDTYRFDPGGLSATFNVERRGDASCCPSGGIVRMFYELRDDQFRISRAERSEPAQESR